MAAAASKEDLREATLRRYNQVVYRLAALTWVITQVFDWSLLTMNLQELASSAVSRMAMVAMLWALQRWMVPWVSWKVSGALFMLLNFGALWGVGTYMWMPSVDTLANLALLIALSTLANILILGVVRSSRITFALGALLVSLWYLFVAAEREFPTEVSWILLGFVLGFATLLYFSIESITNQMFLLEAQHRDAVEAEKNNLAAVIQSMADGVVLTDMEGKVQQANSAFFDMTELAEEQVTGQSIRDLVHLAGAEQEDEGEPNILELADKVFEQEVLVTGGDGEQVKAFLSGAAVLGPAGRGFGRVYVLRDARTSPLAARLNLAELKALKAQINPHFLFNTLNTISSLIMTDPEKAETATQLLSMHFRKVLSVSEREWTTLEEELEFLKAYLEIQQFRYEGQLEVIYKVDPDCLGLRLPTMLLQPLAENAIRHGFRDKFDRWQIEVTVEKCDGLCQITVADNGDGMPRSKLDNLLDGEGHGLKNVSQRLRLYYGEEARISVESEPNHGTKFTLRVPASPLQTGATA
ncbi:MAG: histidine kinase [SAR324 cluster bacterium]|nr:histidine kinase [SAR324 cluster bacterium]